MRFTTLCVRFKTDKRYKALQSAQELHENNIITWIGKVIGCRKENCYLSTWMYSVCQWEKPSWEKPVREGRCAMVICTWRKFLGSWGKRCAMRWGKFIDFGASYPLDSYLEHIRRCWSSFLALFRLHGIWSWQIVDLRPIFAVEGAFLGNVSELSGTHGPKVRFMMKRGRRCWATVCGECTMMIYDVLWVQKAQAFRHEQADFQDIFIFLMRSLCFHNTFTCLFPG